MSRSWLINALANGVYTFGFIMMTPQLFINYKLKSVAHLPWKVFMCVSCIIHMCTTHPKRAHPLLLRWRKTRETLR